MDNQHNDAVNSTKNLVIRVFDECQRSLVNHNRNRTILLNLVKNNDPEFRNSFLHCINNILVIFKREPSVERSITFAVSFTVVAGEEFCNFFLEYLLSRNNSKEKSIRFRVCQLVSLILKKLPDDAEISEEIYESILEQALVRVQDRVPIVRQYAIHSLGRLQDPLDRQDPVLNTMLRLMEFDSSKEVRIACLRQIGVNQLTKPYIINRSLDENEDVRKCFYQCVQEKINVKSLSIKQRNIIIKNGLTDRSSAVNRVVSELLHDYWLKETNNNIIQLLTLLDVENYPEEAGMVIINLLKTPHQTPSPPFHIEQLTMEHSIYWRVRCDQSTENLLGELIPDTVEFVKYLQYFHEKHTFIFTQLLLICHHVNIQDEAGIRQLTSLLTSMLSSLETDDSLISIIMKILKTVHYDENEHIQMILELVSDILDPLESKENLDTVNTRQKFEEKLTELHSSLTDYTQQKDLFIANEDFEAASSIKKKIMVISEEILLIEKSLNLPFKQDAKAWYRIALIIGELLTHTTKTLRHPGIKGVLDSFIQPLVSHKNPKIRCAGLKDLGLYCLLNEDIASSHLFLFIQALHNDENTIKQIVLKTLFDFLLLYPHLAGKKTPEEKEYEPDLTSTPPFSILETLSLYLNHDDVEFRTIAVYGFSKLYYCNCITDNDILCRLLLLFFNPNTEEDSALRQCLSVFFPSFVEQGNIQQKLISECFIPSILALYNAPNSSPLSQINPCRVSLFLLSLLHQTKSNYNNDEIYYYSGFELCKLFLSLLRSTTCSVSQQRSFVKILSQIEIDINQQNILKKYRLFFSKILEETTDKISINNLSRMLENIKIDENDTDNENEDIYDLEKEMSQLNIKQSQPSPMVHQSTKNTIQSKKKLRGRKELKEISLYQTELPRHPRKCKVNGQKKTARDLQKYEESDSNSSSSDSDNPLSGKMVKGHSKKSKKSISGNSDSDNPLSGKLGKGKSKKSNQIISDSTDSDNPLSEKGKSKKSQLEISSD